MNDLSVPALIVGKIGPVLSANVKTVLLRVADTVRVRIWSSIPNEVDEDGGTRYLDLELRGLLGNGLVGGFIDRADVDPGVDVELSVADDDGVGGIEV